MGWSNLCKRWRRSTSVFHLVCVGAGLGFTSANTSAAVVNLTLFNEEALQEQSSDLLLGNALSGDLVQLFSLGLNGIIDYPSDFTGTLGETGDDVLFGDIHIPTHVGAGTFGPSNDSGILLQAGIQFDDSLVGTDLYVRFWNAPTVFDATEYGQTGLLSLGMEVAPGEYLLNFAPMGTGPYITAQNFTPSGYTPEPTVVALLVVSTCALCIRRRFLRCALRPHQLDPSLSIEVSS